MRRSLCVGILKEAGGDEKRAPLSPSDVKWLAQKGIKVEVEANKARIFKNTEYKKAGAEVLNKFKKADMLLGIKAPRIQDLYRGKIYMVFSHATKGQDRNMPLLKACLKDKITLVDYEKITGLHWKRIVYFGRFAGICGLVDSLYYFGKKSECAGIKTPFSVLRPAHKYGSLKKLRDGMAALDREIRIKGFDKRLSPFVIGITGHGNVARGVQEMLELLNPIEIHPKDMGRFIKRQKASRNRIYKIAFLREEKLRAKNGKGFYFEEYLNHPGRFESNLDAYLPYINTLIHTSYWDRRYPRMVTRKMIDRLSKKRPFRLEFIGDISCDVNGSIELTYKTTTADKPAFTYDPKKKKFIDGYQAPGITVMAVDNLPTELAADASKEFAGLIRDYVYQIAAHGARDLTRHAAIPAEIRRATVTQGGRLIKNFTYLDKWIE